MAKALLVDPDALREQVRAKYRDVADQVPVSAQAPAHVFQGSKGVW
jgi:hypothetical protein